MLNYPHFHSILTNIYFNEWSNPDEKFLTLLLRAPIDSRGAL